MVYDLGPCEVPTSEELVEALDQQSKRDIQRIGKIARFDIVVYNPDRKCVQVWARKDGRNRVIINHQIDLRDKHHFLDLVQLIGNVAQLPCTSEEHRVPSPWWAYRFV